MQKRVKCRGIFYASVGMIWDLVAVSIDLVHEGFSPLIIGEGCRKLMRQPRKFPVNIALFSNFVDIVRYKPVVPLHVHLQREQTSQPLREAETQDGTDHSRVVSIRFRPGLLKLPLGAEQE